LPGRSAAPAHLGPTPPRPRHAPMRCGTHVVRTPPRGPRSAGPLGTSPDIDRSHRRTRPGAVRLCDPRPTFCGRYTSHGGAHERPAAHVPHSGRTYCRPQPGPGTAGQCDLSSVHTPFYMVIESFGPNPGTFFDFDEDILPPLLRRPITLHRRFVECRNRPMKKTRGWYTRGIDSPTAPEAVAPPVFARGPKKRRSLRRPGNFSRCAYGIQIRPTAHVCVAGSGFLGKPRMGRWVANPGEKILGGRGLYAGGMEGANGVLCYPKPLREQAGRSR
jgi:hypothetical protein